MIKVNLLKNRAIVAGAAGAPSVKSGTNAGLAEDIGKAGFSKLSFSKEPSTLDNGFDTFECSPIAQLLKLVLLVGFIVPLVGYEKMRATSGKSVISAKNREMQSIQAVKFEKEQAVTAFNGLDAKKEEIKIREAELADIKNHRLTGLYGIDELQTAVPGDVWLTSISFSGENRLDIIGQTLLDSGLDRLEKALKASRRLDRVNIQKDIKTKSKTGRTLNEFKITMSIVDGKKEDDLTEDPTEDLDGR